MKTFVLFLSVIVFIFTVYPFIRPRFAVAFIVAVVLLAVTGCAALPMPMQPKAVNTSNHAEGAWLVLDTIDTLQTIQIAKHHNCLREGDPAAAWLYGSKYPSQGRVIAVNLAGMLVHTMVTSWLDDEVASHPDSGAWVWGRRSWLTVSLAYSGYAVAQNLAKGINPTHVSNSDCYP